MGQTKGGWSVEAEHTFRRVEKKYVVRRAQMDALLAAFSPHMRGDGYGRHTVKNIYFDTPDYALTRLSVEQPAYKEKFRLRGYGTPGEEEIVFAELKKKYDGVVYKRRVVADAAQIDGLLAGRMIAGEDVQTQREILYFLSRYALSPRVFIGYDRIALIGREDERLRVTFDTDLRYRTDRLHLSLGADGEPVLSHDLAIMEIKIPDAAPLWLCRLLSAQRVYPTPFSKIGACFIKRIAPALHAGALPMERREQTCSTVF